MITSVFLKILLECDVTHRYNVRIVLLWGDIGKYNRNYWGDTTTNTQPQINNLGVKDMVESSTSMTCQSCQVRRSIPSFVSVCETDLARLVDLRSYLIDRWRLLNRMYRDNVNTVQIVSGGTIPQPS